MRAWFMAVMQVILSVNATVVSGHPKHVSTSPYMLEQVGVSLAGGVAISIWCRRRFALLYHRTWGLMEEHQDQYRQVLEKEYESLVFTQRFHST